MLVLVTYDVETMTPSGKRRLRQVAKYCTSYGQRVQNSVFECLVDPVQFKHLRLKLEKTIDPEKDSLRYYMLGSNWKNRVEHIGTKQTYDPEGLLLLEQLNRDTQSLIDWKSKYRDIMWIRISLEWRRDR